MAVMSDPITLVPSLRVINWRCAGTSGLEIPSFYGYFLPGEL